MNQKQDTTTSWPEDVRPIPFFKAGELSEVEEYRLLKRIVGEVLCQPHPHVIKLHAEMDDNDRPTGELGITVLRMVGENKTWADFHEAEIHDRGFLEPLRRVGYGSSLLMTVEEFFNWFHPDRQVRIHIDQSDLMDRAWFLIEKAVKQLQDVHLSAVDKYRSRIEFTGSNEHIIPGSLYANTHYLFRHLVIQVMEILKKKMDKEAAEDSNTNAPLY